ncbi:MAG: cytochrome c [Acidobacteria bacterium]|nr:cytochrome c [Acidobacteriota bacterium]
MTTKFPIASTLFALFLFSPALALFGNTSTKAAEIYSAACASCHGSDGRGAPISQVGFDLPLPDFTDCNFAVREPDSDWNAVAHAGGPARAFSRLMPAFGDALGPEELQLATAHVRTFCTDNAWPPGEFNLPRMLVIEKAFPEDEAVFESAVAAQGDGAVSNAIVYEKRFGARNQFELSVPFGRQERATADGGGWQGGIGDIAAGVKRTLFFSRVTGSIFSVAGEVLFPTGDREKGFGRGTTIFEPFLSFGQILPSEFFLQSQAGAAIPVDTQRADNRGFFRFGTGRTFTQGQFGRSWSPMIELLGARDLVAGRTFQWDLVPQIQVTLSRRQHIMMNVGVRTPLTDARSRDTQVLFYFLWDWFDGGLFTGW